MSELIKYPNKSHPGLQMSYYWDPFPADCGMTIVYSFTFSNYIDARKPGGQRAVVKAGPNPTREQVLAFYKEVHDDMMEKIAGQIHTYKVVLSAIVEPPRNPERSPHGMCLHDFAESMGWTPGPTVRNGNSGNDICLFEYDLTGKERSRAHDRNARNISRK